MLRLNIVKGHKCFATAFSLIEVLVAMAIMVVIIVIVTNMFRDASEAWDMGTQRAEMNTAARAAVEYIARELSCTMAGSIPDSAGGTATVRPFTLEPGGRELLFSALSGEDRALRGVMFRFDSVNHIIETARRTDLPELPYDSAAWSWPNAFVLITNVWNFVVEVYTNESDLMSGTPASPGNYFVLPAAVDISIEMLGERDMARALSLSGAQQEGYVMTNSRVYTTRVCFPNRGGGGR